MNPAGSRIRPRVAGIRLGESKYFTVFTEPWVACTVSILPLYTAKDLAGSPRDSEMDEMARWVLGCPDCNQDFTHSQVDTESQNSFRDPFAWLVDKPEIPDSGVQLECPNCKKISIYKRTQLIYRST